MKIKVYLLLGMMLFMSVSVFCQIQDWSKLVALESDREDVEKILGKPEIYFDTFGTYRTRIGRFSIWYSKGGCHKNFEGLQYKVPAGKMTRLIVDMNKSFPVSHYVSENADYKK